MSPIIIAFPPGAGGNHLKNLLDDRYEYNTLRELYKADHVHSEPGGNFKEQNLINFGITHGHFGEILSHQSLLRSLKDKKFIILSPDTPEDRILLYQRRLRLGKDYISILPNTYFDGEQVFLYESFMFYYYFGTPFKNIMNISISEWFCLDITTVLDKLSDFLGKPLDYQRCYNLHHEWCKFNLFER